MSTARGAKLKAQYNRVRTSTALRANDMWTNTIGVEQDPQAGSNAAIEASIYAPTHGGSNRTQRRELAQKLVAQAGYQPSVTDYQGLLTLAKAQGSLGVGSRGACKLCGGIGHLTKQCTNFLTGHNAAAGVETVTLGAVPGGALGLLPDPDGISDLSDLTSDSDSETGKSSGSDSDRGKDADRSKSSKSKKRKRSSKSKKSKEKKESKDRKEKTRKAKKSKKHKKAKDSSSDTD